jgi:hypothetical protein
MLRAHPSACADAEPDAEPDAESDSGIYSCTGDCADTGFNPDTSAKPDSHTSVFTCANTDSALLQVRNSDPPVRR